MKRPFTVYQCVSPHVTDGAEPFHLAVRHVFEKNHVVVLTLTVSAQGRRGTSRVVVRTRRLRLLVASCHISSPLKAGGRTRGGIPRAPPFTLRGSELPHADQSAHPEARPGHGARLRTSNRRRSLRYRPSPAVPDSRRTSCTRPRWRPAPAAPRRSCSAASLGTPGNRVAPLAHPLRESDRARFRAPLRHWPRARERRSVFTVPFCPVSPPGRWGSGRAMFSRTVRRICSCDRVISSR